MGDAVKLAEINIQNCSQYDRSCLPEHANIEYRIRESTQTETSRVITGSLVVKCTCTSELRLLVKIAMAPDSMIIAECMTLNQS